LEDVDTPVALSPDDKEMAFVRASEAGRSDLLVIRADGTGERTLASRKLPDQFDFAWYNGSGPDWSPDRRVLALVGITASGGAGRSGALGSTVVAVPASGGSAKSLTAKAWDSVGRVAWLRNGRGLVFNAAEQSSPLSSQLWLLSYPSGELRRITNDLN